MSDKQDQKKKDGERTIRNIRRCGSRCMSAKSRPNVRRQETRTSVTRMKQTGQVPRVRKRFQCESKRLTVSPSRRICTD
jgi:hypothetical protein